MCRPALRTIPFAVGFLLLSGAIANAQTNAELPEFEVASVKPIKVGGITGVQVFPGGRVVISNLPLKTLVQVAFRLSYWQISGGDAWTEKENYYIEAKPPENLRSSITNLRYSWYGIEDEHLRQMLQALLIDRFQLKFHTETKTGRVYLLEKSGRPLRLRPARTAAARAKSMGNAGFSGDIDFVGGRWSLFNTAMPQLAKFASDYILHAPVLDRTDLHGAFDYRQPNALPESEANYADNSDSFRRLIPELGLKQRTEGPVETFVIDHAEKPSPN